MSATELTSSLIRLGEQCAQVIKIFALNYSLLLKKPSSKKGGRMQYLMLLAKHVSYSDVIDLHD